MFGKAPKNEEKVTTKIVRATDTHGREKKFRVKGTMDEIRSQVQDYRSIGYTNVEIRH